MNRKKINVVVILILLLLSISCSEKNNYSSENLKNKKLIDSLSTEKKSKTLEAKELKSELDSLRNLRDSLNSIQSKKQK